MGTGSILKAPLAMLRRGLRRRSVPLFAGYNRTADGELRLFGLEARRSTAKTYELERLHPGSTSEFSLVCPVDGFCGLGISLGEATEETTFQISVELGHRRSDRRLVCQRRISVSNEDWSDWQDVAFEPVEGSAGATVHVSLSVRRGRLSLRRVVLTGAWRWRPTRPEVLAQRPSPKRELPKPRPLTPGSAFAVRTPRPLRILTHRWHVPHQYELYKLPHRFGLVYELPDDESPFCRRWDYRLRPKPPNAALVPWGEIRPADFDLLLLHFDENVVEWQNTNGMVAEEWGATFRFLLGQREIPKVAICHGTPQFRGMCDPSYDGPLFDELSRPKQRLIELLGDTLVICNSHQAARQWAFPRQRVVWHGFDPREFRLGRRRGGILGPSGFLLRSRPHYAGRRLSEAVAAKLPSGGGPAALGVPEPSGLPWPIGNEYAHEKFRSYVDALGEYAVYFNPTLNSPMPRSRGEAMMCGLVTVSAANHDVEQFIDNERNGFYATQPEQLADYLRYLVRHPERALEIGLLGRQRAKEAFHIGRYLGDWERILRDLVT